MSLSTVLAEINKLKPVAEEDTDQGPVETMNGRRGRKRQAIESLKRLKEEYSKDLMRSAVFIIVSGSSREEFTKLATEKYGCFSEDPELFYKDLAGRIPEAIYKGKDDVGNMFDILGRHLEDKAMELNIIGYPQLIFKQQYRRAIKTKGEFVALIKRAINEQVGTEVVGIQTVRSIVDSAIERGHDAKVTPIILETSDDELVKEMVRDLERLTPRVFLVLSGKSSKTLKGLGDSLTVKEANEESVEKTLLTIKSSLKK